MWITTELFTEEQTIRVQPTVSFGGITLEFKESGDGVYGRGLYLSKSEMNELIAVMRQIMDHVENSK